MKKILLVITLLLFGCEEEVPKVLELIGEEAVTVTLGDDYIDAGVNLVEGEYTLAGSVDTSSIGVYKLVYTSTDGQQVTRTILVAEPLAHEFFLKGDLEMFVEIGSVYEDPGYKISFGTVEVTDNVDINNLGVYEVTYVSGDKSLVRVVHVVDTTPPVIELQGEELMFGDLATYVDEGYVAIDNSEQEVDVTVEDIMNDSMTKRTIVYTATDSSGNTVIAERVIYHIVPTEVKTLRSLYGINGNDMYSNNGKHTFNPVEMSYDSVYDESINGLTANVNKVADSRGDELLFIGTEKDVVVYVGEQSWSKTFDYFDVVDGVLLDDGVVVIVNTRDIVSYESYIEKYDVYGKLVWRNGFDDYGRLFSENVHYIEDRLLVDVYYEKEPDRFFPVTVEMNHEGEVLGTVQDDRMYHYFTFIDDELYASGSYRGKDGIFKLSNSLTPTETIYEDNQFYIEYFSKIDEEIYVVFGYEFTFVNEDWVVEHFLKIVTADGVLIEEILYDESYKGFSAISESDEYVYFAVEKNDEHKIYVIPKLGE